MLYELTSRWRAAERRFLRRFLPYQHTGPGVPLTHPWDSTVQYEVDGKVVIGLEYNDMLTQNPNRCRISARQPRH